MTDEYKQKLRDAVERLKNRVETMEQFLEGERPDYHTLDAVWWMTETHMADSAFFNPPKDEE